MAAASMEALADGLTPNTAAELGRRMNLQPWQVEVRVMTAVNEGRAALSARLAKDGVDLDQAAANMGPAQRARFDGAIQQMVQTNGRVGYRQALAALRG